ncbi:PQQ-binding-like beta-propeller repeat protein [Thermodesulfobacteriota bacterium]
MKTISVPVVLPLIMGLLFVIGCEEGNEEVEIVWTKDYAYTQQAAISTDMIYLKKGSVFCCIDSKTGEEVWSQTLESDEYTTGEFAVFDNRIFISEPPRFSDNVLRIRCLDANTGNTIWTRYTEGSVSSAWPIVSKDYLFINNLNRLSDVCQGLSISKETGKVLVTTDLLGCSQRLGALKEEHFYIAYRNTISCLNVNQLHMDGGDPIVWEYRGDEKDYFSGLMVTDGYVFAHHYYEDPYNNSLFCINAEDGNKLWDLKYDNANRGKTYLDGNLFLSYDSKIACVSVKTKKTLWEFEFDRNINSPAIPTGNRLYFTTDTEVYCLDAKTGKKIWVFKPTSEFKRIHDTPILISDNNIYLFTETLVYCLRDADNDKLPWLSFGANPGLTWHNDPNEKLAPLSYPEFDDGITIADDNETEEIEFKNATLNVVKNQLIANCYPQIVDSQVEFIKDELDKIGASVVGVIPGLHMLQIRIPDGDSYEKVADKISELPGIRNVVPNVLLSSLSVSTFPDYDEISFLGQWYEVVNVKTGWDVLDKLGLPIGDSKIGVVDSGFSQDNIPRIYKENISVYNASGKSLGTNLNTNIDLGSKKDHGTIVSAIACSDGDNESNKMDYIGVAWKSPLVYVDLYYDVTGNYFSVKDDRWYASTYNLACGISTAIGKGCKTINVSQGDISLEGIHRIYEGLWNAIDSAAREEVLIVFSAGQMDEGKTGIRNFDDYFSSDTDMTEKTRKAWDNNTIIVAGTNDTEEVDYSKSKIHKSSHDGLAVDIAAPYEIGIYYLDEEEQVRTADWKGGTSYSAPMITGAASLIRTVRDDLLPFQIKDILIKSSRKIISDAINPDCGRLDIGGALEEAVFYGTDFDLTGPGEVLVGETYTLSWNEIQYATKYIVSELWSWGQWSKEKTSISLKSNDVGTREFNVYAYNEDLDLASQVSPSITVEVVLTTTTSIRPTSTSTIPGGSSSTTTSSIDDCPGSISINPSSISLTCSSPSDTVTLRNTGDCEVYVGIGTEQQREYCDRYSVCHSPTKIRISAGQENNISFSYDKTYSGGSLSFTVYKYLPDSDLDGDGLEDFQITKKYGTITVSLGSSCN